MSDRTDTQDQNDFDFGGVDFEELLLGETSRTETVIDLLHKVPDFILYDPEESHGSVGELWPDSYVNNKTKKRYKPHKEIEEIAVFTDSPRYTLFKGGEGCIAPETKISGTPIAELTQRSMVDSLYGQAIASPSYLKGRDDLYQVELEDGRTVTVTKAHRFLTPTGYAKLKHLGVGSSIAVNDEDEVTRRTYWNIRQSVEDWHLASAWIKIKSIKFDRYGDYYDIQVPVFEHYICDNGIVHHNSGKSVAGIIKGLERVRRGLDGICVSPDFPHFRRSLWAEWQRWCPWDCVIEPHRYFGNLGWSPYKPFQITFINGATIYFGGIETPIAWEGPNVNWAHFDEARRKDNPEALKVLDGRVRIWGEANVMPQMWITTTPAKHWLFDYFGPVKRICNECDEHYQPDTQDDLDCPACNSEDTREDEEDQFVAFKRDSRVVTLQTQDNEANLGGDGETGGYAEKRGQSLTESEKRVLLLGLWEDVESVSRFLPSMVMWENCKINKVPKLTKRIPVVVAMDAGVSGDYFAMVVVSAHPEFEDGALVRFSMLWKPPINGKIDYQGTDTNPGPEKMIELLCRNFNVLSIAYDPYQLHDMATRIEKRRKAKGDKKLKFVEIKEFTQSSMRIKSDTQLLNLISQGIIGHDGTHSELNKHISNSDRKTDDYGRNLRIVKRTEKKKIDLTVCLSMAVERFLSMPLKIRMPKKINFHSV